MKIVLDTNVLVSALLTPGRSADKLVREHVASGRVELLLDWRIVDEYREVLARPRFGLDANLVDDLVADLESVATFVDAPTVTTTATPEDDLPFLEVAIAGEADVIVTGNKRHYPDTRGIEVLGPGELLARLEVAGR